MDKEETLHKIKSVEEEIRRSKQGALTERERILRTARKDALELRDALRAEAEKRGEQIRREASEAVAREKETILTAGRQEAATYRGMAESNMDRAVERLVEKFKGAAHA